MAGKTKTEVSKAPAKKAAPVKVEFKQGSKKVNLYKITGSVDKKIALPAVFDVEFRRDVIRKAVKAAQANRRQAYGPAKRSGLRHSVATFGKGRGTARVQRLKQGHTATESPNNVSGRRAHPPYPERVFTNKVNKKEKKFARNSALAALSDLELVAARGHKFNRKLTLPLVVSDSFEKIQKTKKAVDSLNGLGVFSDVVRAKEGKHIRSGKGKTRGRKYRTPTSILIIVTNKENLEKAVGNLPGVDIITPRGLNAELLAPGGDPGRLAVISQSALLEMGGW